MAYSMADEDPEGVADELDLYLALMERKIKKMRSRVGKPSDNRALVVMTSAIENGLNKLIFDAQFLQGEAEKVLRKYKNASTGDMVQIARELTASKIVRLKKDKKTKSGVTFEKGEKLEVVGWGSYTMVLETDDGRKIAFSYETAHKSLTGFSKPPSMRTLEDWIVNDATAKSVDGKRVEPDGYTSDGAPSWLLALGMI